MGNSALPGVRKVYKKLSAVASSSHAFYKHGFNSFIALLLSLINYNRSPDNTSVAKFILMCSSWYIIISVVRFFVMRCFLAFMKGA